MKLPTTAAMAVVVPAIVLGAAVATHAPQVHAGTSAANATGFCQGALPAFDTSIRKRPLGVNNEGSSNAFVSCSIPVAHNAVSVDNAIVFMTNRNAVPLDVSCTFVNGAAVGPVDPPEFYTKNVNLVPNTFTALIWTTAEFALTTFHPYENFSCNLPPGVELNVVGFDYTDPS